MSRDGNLNPTRTVRIGGAGGYWGDSQQAPRQRVLRGDIDYLVFDYRAEVTMSVQVRTKEKSADCGYCRDFVDLVMKSLIHEIKQRGIRVVVNAGGFRHTVAGEVERYDLPGMNAFILLLTRCLGGGTSSLQLDTQAETYAQQLLAKPISVPRSLAEKVQMP